MSVREAKAGDLIRALIPNGRPAWGDRYAAELDRRERELLDRVAKLESRFPVPVERDATKVNECKAANVFNARTCALVEGHDGYHWADGFCWTTYQEPPRAESTGKKMDAQCQCSSEDRHVLGCPALAPAPAAPTDEWVTIGELECGAVFETRDGIRAVKSEYRYSNAPHAQCLCVLVASGEYAHFDLRNEEPVRELRILAADEIAVRIDDATVDLIVAFMCPGYVSKLSEAVREDYKFTARCILEALSKRGGGK